MSKRVLIITYYWPPAGGIGVQRCLKFAKYLHQQGWEPVIYTASNALYSYYDESGYKDIPEGLEVIKHKIVEPFGIYKLLSRRKKTEPVPNPIHVRSKKTNILDRLAIWIRGNFFIPDARALWIKPSVRFLSKYLRQYPVDAILSDGPPHTNTVIACRISKKFNLSWLADFQDPWTQVDYYKLLKLTRRADRKHREMEQEVFRTAKAITIASPTWKKDLEKIGARNVHVVYYGYDEDDFKHLEAGTTPEQFVISHAGLLGYDRNPEIFFKVIRDILSEHPQRKKVLKLLFPGSIDFSVKESIRHLGLTEVTDLPGILPRPEALRVTMTSSLLLLPLNKAENARGRIPGKLFEYLRAGKPILALGPVDSDVAGILGQTGHGQCFEYDDYEGIKNYVLRHLKSSGSIAHTEGRKDVSVFSVENQTRIIASILNAITRNEK
jgi:glycosyltransferase involved in cell wall biosynthesis